MATGAAVYADPWDPRAFGLTPVSPTAAPQPVAPASAAPANPFDRFDPPATPTAGLVPAVTSTPPNPFDRFDPPPAAPPGHDDVWNPSKFGLTPASPHEIVQANDPRLNATDGSTAYRNSDGSYTLLSVAPSQAQPPKISGVPANIAAGGNSAIADTVGMPVDIATGGINLLTRGVNAVAGTSIPPITDPVGGSGSIKRLMGVVGADPDNVEASTPTERFARTAAQGATTAFIPAGVAGLGLKAGMMSAPAVDATLSALGRPTVGNALLSAGAAVGGDAAAQAAPDAYKPVAGVLGGLAVGGVGGGFVAAGQGARNALSDIGKGVGAGPRNALLDLAGGPIADTAGAPIVATKAQADAAAQKLTSSASDPDAARQALATPTVSATPGVPLTTYQITGDQGLGMLERGVSQKDPTPFIDVRNQQNAARVDALQGMTPATASPADVSAAFRQQLAGLDAAHQTATDQARATLGEAAGQLGGVATDAADGTAQQQYGQQARAGLDAANQAAKAREGALWVAVDPDGTLAVDASPIRAAAQQVLREHGQFATPLGGDEANILDLGAQAPVNMKFSDLKDYRSQLTDVISQARQNGDAQTARRLSMVLDGVHQALDGAVEQRASSDARAVQAGQMTPEQTMLAALQRLNSDAGAREAAAANVGARVVGGEGFGGRAQSPPSVGLNGTAGQGRGGFVGPPGTPGLPSQAQPVTPFDDAAAGRYAAARQATAERHSTFTNAPGVGSVLQPGRWSGEFKMPDSQVISALTSGTGTAERVQAYLRAGGDPDVLAGGLASDLRRVAQNPDGTINPAKLTAWQNTRSQALAALPDLQQRVSTVAGAQDALDRAAGAQTATRQAYEASAAGKFLGDADPVKQVASILGSNRSQAQMQQLAQLTANEAAARAGLQRAVVDHILTQMQGDKLAGQTGTTQLYGAQLQKFIRQKAPALREIMTPGQMRVMDDLAESIQRSDLSLGGNVLPAGSPTAQNAAAMNRAGVGGTLLDEIKRHGIETLMGGGTGAAVGSAIAGPLGAVVGGSVGTLAGRVYSGLRTANIATVNGLVREAMLNPELARVLMSRVTPESAPNIGKAFAATLRRSAVVGGATGVMRQQNEMPRAPMNPLAELGTATRPAPSNALASPWRQ